MAGDRQAGGSTFRDTDLRTDKDCGVLQAWMWWACEEKREQECAGAVMAVCVMPCVPEKIEIAEAQDRTVGSREASFVRSADVCAVQGKESGLAIDGRALLGRDLCRMGLI